jgi:hypothetical protein
MRIPLNSSSIYNLNSNQLWLGFEIDPPNFRIQNNDNTTAGQQRYGRGRMAQGSNTSRMNLRQRMGQYERWYNINLSE